MFCVLLLATVVVVSGTGNRGGSRVAVTAAIPEIILELDSAQVPAADSGSWLNLYLTNTLHDVGAYEIYLLLDSPDLFEFRADSVVETTIVCIDTIDCDPADTTIDTVATSSFDTAGTASSGWDLVSSRVVSQINLKLVAIADQPGGGTVPAIPTGGPRLLTRVWLSRTVPSEILDTLTNRTAFIFVDQVATHFSTSDAQTIGRLDSTVVYDSIFCVNPPVCDTLDTIQVTDTVFYFDTTAFVYIRGARTWGPSCILGDVNNSGTINSADIIYLVGYVFRGGPPPACNPNGGDVTCNGRTDAADIILIVNHVFKGAPAPSGC